MSRINVANFRHPDATADSITLTSGGGTEIGGLTYPTSDGTNGQYLQTNGSGALSWQTVQTPAILQVLSDTNGTTASNLGGSMTQVPGLEVTITPASTSSRFIVLVSLYVDGSSTSYGSFEFRISGSNSGLGNTPAFARSTGNASMNSMFLDHSPNTTSDVTYQLFGKSDSGTLTVARGTMIVYEVAS